MKRSPSHISTLMLSNKSLLFIDIRQQRAAIIAEYIYSGTTVDGFLGKSVFSSASVSLFAHTSG